MNFIRIRKMQNYKLIVPEEIEQQTMSILYDMRCVQVQSQHYSNPLVQHQIYNIEKYLHSFVQIVKDKEHDDIQINLQTSREINEQKHTWLSYMDYVEKRSEQVYRRRQQEQKIENEFVRRKKQLEHSKILFEIKKRMFDKQKQSILLAENYKIKFGVFGLQQSLKIKRSLYRITRGNFYLYSQIQQQFQYFIVIFLETFLLKLEKLLNQYTIDIPYNLEKCINQLQEINQILQLMETKKQNYPQQNEEMYKYFLFINKWKTINQNKGLLKNGYWIITLWLFDQDQEIQDILEQWCGIPQKVYQQIKQSDITKAPKQLSENLLRQLQRNVIHLNSKPLWSYVVNPKNKSPTYIEVNQYTYPAKYIVTTYGIPQIGQINPSVFVIVFFPFLFGIMFGDIGHGSILMILSIFFGGQYRTYFMLMSFFSVYSGFIYNECFGMKLPIFQSCINQIESPCVYPMGIDYAWKGTVNGQHFLNSYKLKLSMIIAFFHMMFGMFIRVLNNLHFKQFMLLLINTLPKITLMTVTVGYMVFLILKKWQMEFEQENRVPSILTILLEIFLGHQEDKFPQILYSSLKQHQLYSSIVKYITLISSLFLLTAEPLINLIHYIFDKIFVPSYQPLFEQKEKEYIEEQKSPLQNIEFILSIFSYYLLCPLLIRNCLSCCQFSCKTLLIGVVLIFIGATIGLIAIDSMQCVMHTIRLIWVEWMSRFWRGQGRQWVPLGVN